MPETAIPIANPVVVLREEFDDWAILYNPDTAEATAINPIGVFVWKHIDGRRNLGEIVTAVGAACEGVTASVADDIAAFVQDLVVRGFAGYELESAGR